MTQNDLQLLFSRPERLQPSVLSVYLNVDQSRQANLNRGFERRLKDMLSSIRTTIHDAPETERFKVAAHHVTDFVSAYTPHERGLAMFFDAVDGFFWHAEIDVTLPAEARWDREALSRPLANALDQFERYGVVLVGRTSMRLFSVFLGEIEELSSLQLGPKRTRHIKTAGTDHIGSASRIQRKTDEEIRISLKRVVRLVDSFVQEKQVQRLILAGTSEVTAELRDSLPKRLGLRMIGTVDIFTDAPLEKVLAATLPIAEECERNTEIQTVKEVVTAAAKQEHALVGLGHVLKAVNSERVWQLVYADGFASPGFECSKCSALFSLENPSCQYCGAAVRPVDDVVERAVEHACRNGARIEVVTGEAAASLASAGGIGAFLKTRTASLRA
jgi:peptide chain release factor subunit 1